MEIKQFIKNLEAIKEYVLKNGYGDIQVWTKDRAQKGHTSVGMLDNLGLTYVNDMLDIHVTIDSSK